MYDERIDQSRLAAGHPGRLSEAGTGRHRAPADVFRGPLVPPDSAWDPAEELAFMLQDVMAENGPPLPPVADVESAGTPAPGTPLDNLQEITAELPPLKTVPRGHRKVRARKPPSGLKTVSHVIAALAAVVASMVSCFCGMVAYEPLRLAAVSRVQSDIVSWWPLLVYGPWLVASLSVLRAALHQRRAVHSWSVVLLFSSVAVLLCVVQAPRNIIDIAAAALPGLSSLACFQQFVRQITLTRPPRRTLPRHRLQRPSSDDGDQAESAVKPASPASPVSAPSTGTGGS